MSAEPRREAPRRAETGSLASPSSATLHQGDVSSGLELVLFDWEGLPFALQASQVRALRSAVDPTQPSIGALLGLDGAVSYRGLAPASEAPPTERLLEVEVSNRPMACFRVQEPVQTRFFAASALRPLPPLLAACLHGGAVRAIAREPLVGRLDGRQGGTVRLIPVLDVRRFPTLE